MSQKSDIQIRIDEEGEPSKEFLEDRSHSLRAWYAEDGIGGQVYLNFSTRLAVVEFAKSLLGAAYYEESGMREWDPQDGLPKDRVRLTDDSAKLLLFYGHDSPVPTD